MLSCAPQVQGGTGSGVTSRVFAREQRAHIAPELPDLQALGLSHNTGAACTWCASSAHIKCVMLSELWALPMAQTQCICCTARLQRTLT